MRASSRNPSELHVSADVETVALDLNEPDTFAAALDGVSKVFLYAESDGFNDLLDAAGAAGVERIVLLSSNTVTLPEAEDDALARHHGLAEAALVGSGLSHTTLRPGAFAGNAAGWAPSIQANAPVEQAFANSQVASVHEDDIADVAVVALTGDSLEGQAVLLTGPESLTFREEVDTIAGLLGRDIPVHDLSRAEAVKHMGRFMPTPVLASLLNPWEAGIGTPADISAVTEQVTGRPARPFRQ